VLAVQMKVSDQVAPKSIPDLSGGP
jgi:hypothetical protein